MHNIVIKGERTTVLGRQLTSQSYFNPKHICTHIEIIIRKKQHYFKVRADTKTKNRKIQIKNFLHN